MCCYNYGCCCGCCQYPKKPSGCANFVVMILFLASAGTIIGLSIAGLVHSTKLNFEYRKIKCSILLFINEVIEGASEEYSVGVDWKGVTQTVEDISASLGGIDEEAMKTVAEEEYDFLGEADYNYASDVLKNIKEEFEATNNKVTDPWKGGEDLVLDILYGKVYGNELFAHLDAEIEAYKHIYTLMPGVVNAAKELGDGGFDDINDALDAINDFEGQIKDLRDDIDDMLDFGNSPVKIAQLAMTIYYAVIIGCSSITILGSIFLALCKCNEWRCMNTFGCLILTLLMILGFLLTAVLMPVSVVLIEVCDVFELENLKEDRSIINQDTWDELKICLDKDSSISSKFGLDEKIESFKDAEEGAKEISEIYDDAEEPGNEKCRVKYNHAQKMITELKRIRDESPEEAAPDAFMHNSPSILNEQCPNNKIVWFEEECGTMSIVSADNPFSEPNTCFPIASLCDNCDDYTDSNACASFPCTGLPCSDFLERLEHLCDYYKGLEKKIDDLILHIERKEDSGGLSASVSNSFKSAMDEDNYKMEICQVMGDLGASEKGLSGFGEALADLSDYLEEFDCSFVQGNYNRVHIAICGSFVQNFTSTAFFLGIISAITFISMVFLICVNRKFHIQKDTE